MFVEMVCHMMAVCMLYNTEGLLQFVWVNTRSPQSPFRHHTIRCVYCTYTHTYTHTYSNNLSLLGSTWRYSHWAFSPTTALDSSLLEPFCTLWERFALSPSSLLPPIPPRMFIAQKIISLVILAPLWAAINFSSLHDGPACGHRSLTFSKRSINLSVHPATYPLMFSSFPVVFSPLLLSLGSGCWVVKWL